MGIMDVLEQLSGPEYDEPSPLEETSVDQILDEIEAAENSAQIIDVEGIAAPAPQQVETTVILEEAYPDSNAMLTALRKPKRIRPEWILGLLALLAAAVLILTVMISKPYFGSHEEDPEALLQRHQQNFEPLQVTESPEETFLEPTISETEPENPTIPPDTNPYDRYDFQYNRHNYLLLQNVKSYAGVDVSAYQGNIDWEAVKASGIHFAIIRLGYRGYESGKLVEDEYAIRNLEGARAAGLKVGAYFFSQALSIKETDQEIDFILGILGEFPLDMPIVLDWEIPSSTARTAGMDKQTLTDIQLHFCGQMRDRGYQPMIYFNWYQSENLYDLHALEEYPFWLALYQDRMTYPWKIEMWQWTSTGKVPGIAGNVDINVYMPD